jgi:hypothetical protein
MFKSENVLQEFATTRVLYCVWIRADETPGAPLVPVWIDSKMRAFEGPEEVARTVTVGLGRQKAGPKAVRRD